MLNYSDDFGDLVQIYADRILEYPDLKLVTLAMWILESGRGKSRLAIKHNNFAGMKYRSEMKPWAKRMLYNAHDGSSYYCAFEDLDSFLSGFWAFLERYPYTGWKDRANDPKAFICFVGPIWAADPSYAEKVLALLPEAKSLLSKADETPTPQSGTNYGRPGLLPGRPSLSLTADGKAAVGSEGLAVGYHGVDTCPYGKTASRKKQDFDAIVLHHTEPRHSTEWYVKYQIDGDSKRGGHFGYHFYIAPDGKILQGAPLTKRTNHVSPATSVRRSFGAFAHNFNAIGITNSGAGLPDRSSPSTQQQETTKTLVFALCDLFDIPFANVFGHGEVQNNRMMAEGRDLARLVRSWGETSDSTQIV